MKNVALIEQSQIKPVVVAGTDMNIAAITGARVALKNFDKVAVVASFGDSTGAVVQMTLRQHTAASGGTSKVLSVKNAHYHKVAALDVFTKVEPSSARSLVDASTQFAADEGILVIEVRSEDLDKDGGFNFFSVDFADSTAAKLISAVYILGDARYEPAYNVATV